jgi:hypothetical protein
MTTGPVDKAAPAAVEADLDSSEDDDFNPGAIPPASDAEGLSSDSDSDFGHNEVTTKKPKGKKRKQANGGDLDLELASGDEATIRKGKRRRQKKAKGAATDSDEASDDQGGEGGLIKTRAQRAREYALSIPVNHRVLFFSSIAQICPLI